MATISIWPGSSSFVDTINPTPFGFYDSDPEFQTNADKAASWCAQRLGYPIVDIELQDTNFYTCYEEAVNTYAQYLYQYAIIENIGTLLGTGTTTELNGEYISPNLGNVINIAENYGGASFTGGNIDYKTGSIELTPGQQRYSLQELWADVSESGERMEIKNIYHHSPPAIVRYFDPYAGTGTGIQSLMESFGFGNYSPGVNFMLMPIYFDVLKIQAIEFNDQIRKSAYSFELINNNQLKIFPIPNRELRLHFEYVLKSDRNNPINDEGSGAVSDVSNVPYGIINFATINSPGKNWILRYMLALAKEMLANIRGKYTTIPIPGSEITTNAEALRAEAAAEKEKLLEDLKFLLFESSRSQYLERGKGESANIQETLNKVPFPIYIY